MQAWRQLHLNTLTRERPGTGAPMKPRTGFWSMDPCSMKLSCSDGIYRVLGFDPRGGDLSYEQAMARIPEKFRSMLDAELRSAIRQQKMIDLEVSVIRADGGLMSACLIAEPVVVDSAVVQLTGTLIDIDSIKDEAARLMDRLAGRKAELIEAQRLARVGSWLVDADTGAGEWSQTMFEIFGMDPSQPAPHSDRIRALFEPQSRALLDSAMKSALEDGVPYALELELVTPQGERRWVSGRGEPVRNASGRIGGLRGTAQDITDRRRSEQALQEREHRLRVSERQFRTALQFAPIGMALVALDGSFMQVNQALCRLVGYTAEELQALSFQQITHAADLGPDLAHLRSLLSGERESFKMEKRYVRKDGSPVWTQLTVTLLRDEHGQPQHYISQIEDIQERKTSQEQLQKLAQRVALAARSGDLGVWEWDLGSNELTWDAQMYEIYGIEEGTPLNYLDWLETVLPEDRDQFDGALSPLIDNAAETSVSFRICHPQLGERHIEGSGQMVFGQDARGIRVVGVNKDVTERYRVQKLLRDSEERFRLMVDAAVDYALFMLDADGRIASWNLGAQRLHGYTAEQIVGQHFSCFFTEEDRALGLPAESLRLADAAQRHETEGWCMRLDGSRFWGGVVLTAVRDPDGRLIGYSKMSRDLSQRREAETRLVSATLLRESIVEASPFAIVAVDTDGLIRSFNAAAERMLGYSREEMIGLQTPELFHDPLELHRRAQALVDNDGSLLTPMEMFEQHAQRAALHEQEWTYRRKDGTRFPGQLTLTPLRDGDGAITGYLGFLYDVTERKQREQYTHYIAHHDALTGLPNRLLMNDRLDQAMKNARRANRSVALLMIDLDHFKRVNDSLGHQLGDDLLKVVAERLQRCVRSADTVARMSGDEFLVLLTDLDPVSVAERVAMSIIEAVGKPICLGPHELTVTASIGISVFPQDGANGDVLLRNADTAMYRAKSSGRAMYSLFDSELERQIVQRMETEKALRQALRNNEFELHYQPQVSLVTGHILGVEALLRWRHPVKGMILPGEFIPIAEDCGLIVAIGEWVLRTACRETVALQKVAGHPVGLSVNISPRQFRRQKLRETLARALDDSGLAPHLVEVEITEGVLMESLQEAGEILDELRSLGVTIGIDDFGTGFSSLSYITQLPINTLKIDRSFISRSPTSPKDAAVTQAIFAMAQSLNLKVVAEGVESIAQLRFLLQNDAMGRGTGTERGATERFSMQGFHFSKGLPLPELLADCGALQAEYRRRIDRAMPLPEPASPAPAVDTAARPY